MRVKICGITDADIALYAAEQGADMLGFVFARSKRQVTPEQAKSIIDCLPADIEKVGVFVNETADHMQEIADYCGLTILQLHGEESAELCGQLSYPVIKAVGVSNLDDVRTALEYPADYVLIDSPKGHVYQGGNGQTFDWDLAGAPMRKTEKKVILAGGLNHENVQEAITIVRPYIVDVSSGVETNGTKDYRKIRLFIKTAKGGLEQ